MTYLQRNCTNYVNLELIHSTKPEKDIVLTIELDVRIHLCPSFDMISLFYEMELTNAVLKNFELFCVELCIEYHLFIIHTEKKLLDILSRHDIDQCNFFSVI